MKFSNEDVMNAILNNDTARVAAMLEGFDLLKDGTPPHFTSADKSLVSTMLGAASAMDWHDDLADDLAEELVERTAMTVDIFQFLRLVMIAARIKTEDYDKIPEEIRETLLKCNSYSDEIARAIEELDHETFEALIAFIPTDEIERISTKFNLPIVRRVYAEGMIPTSLMFAFMANSLRETIDEHFGDLGLLSALFDVMRDDEEEEEEEDEED